jgi:hypothetical protein
MRSLVLAVMLVGCGPRPVRPPPSVPTTMSPDLFVGRYSGMLEGFRTCADGTGKNTAIPAVNWRVFAQDGGLSIEAGACTWSVEMTQDGGTIQPGACNVTGGSVSLQDPGVNMQIDVVEDCQGYDFGLLTRRSSIP